MSDFPVSPDFPCDSSRIFIPGPSGHLEALCQCPKQKGKPIVAIICHPHPLYGGSMQNKVVHTLDKTFNRLGLSTVRFNFRGVGQSAGYYDNGQGELDDLNAVIEWCMHGLPGYQLWLAGFSFGAYICMKAAQTIRVDQLITVAPPVNIFDFSKLLAPASPWLVIQGDADEIVDVQQVNNWLKSFESVELAMLEGAGHFFHARLNDLQKTILERLTV